MSDLIRKAQALFKRFHAREPEAGEIVRLQSKAEPAFKVGELIGVIYKTDKEQYIHEFKASDRPGLFSSSDGQQLYIVAGQYVFTDRGIID